MAMQAKAMILSCVLAVGWAGTAVATDRRGDRPGGSEKPGSEGRHGRPEVFIEPNIIISRPPRPDVDAPEFIMAEIEGCAAAGVRLFVDCLRHNHGSIMIRRLEACVRSETIPDDPGQVAACLPPTSLRPSRLPAMSPPSTSLPPARLPPASLR